MCCGNDPGRDTAITFGAVGVACLVGAIWRSAHSGFDQTAQNLLITGLVFVAGFAPTGGMLAHWCSRGQGPSNSREQFHAPFLQQYDKENEENKETETAGNQRFADNPGIWFNGKGGASAPKTNDREFGQEEGDQELPGQKTEAPKV